MVTSPFRAKLSGLFHSLSEQSFPLIRPRCSRRQVCREKLRRSGLWRELDPTQLPRAGVPRQDFPGGGSEGAARGEDEEVGRGGPELLSSRL